MRTPGRETQDKETETYQIANLPARKLYVKKATSNSLQTGQNMRNFLKVEWRSGQVQLEKN